MAATTNIEELVCWTNAKDSLLHALDHFIEIRTAGSNKWHHQKWIIISVHHAASCLASIWLREADSNHPLLIGKSGEELFPHLDKLITALRKFRGTAHLTEAEDQLLTLLGRLNDIRNKFMHRKPPSKLDNDIVAYAATSMVGMLHVSSGRTGKSFHDLFDQFPDIRRFITEAIHYKKVEEYCSFVEQILADRGYTQDLPQCPGCLTRAIIGNHCEACFEDVSEIECPQCQDNFHVLSSYPLARECPSCGYEH